MSNYIPHYTKKLRIRRRKEAELRRLLQRGADLESLVKQAAEVRVARIRALNARLATIPPCDAFEPLISRLTRQIDAAAAVSPEMILREFGQPPDLNDRLAP